MKGNMKVIKYSNSRYGNSVVFLNLEQVVRITCSDTQISYDSVLGTMQGCYTPVLYGGSKSDVLAVYELINDFIGNSESVLDLTIL